MSPRIIHLLWLAALVFATAGLALAKPDTTDYANLHSIKLLNGYVVETHLNQDTQGGSITKKGGLQIGACIGEMVGLAACPQNKETFPWFQTQEIDGKPVYLALTKPDKGITTLIVSYSVNYANFTVDISSPADVAEALAMILTYEPPKPK